MARHDVNLGVNRTLGGPAFIAAAIAIGTTDAVLNLSGGNWIITGIVGGLIGWGAAHSQPGAGGGVVASAAVLFALAVFIGMS